MVLHRPTSSTVINAVSGFIVKHFGLVSARVSYRVRIKPTNNLLYPFTAHYLLIQLLNTNIYTVECQATYDLIEYFVSLGNRM